MLIWYFSNNLDIYDYVWKLPEQHLSVWFFSNPGDKIYSCWNLMKPGSQSGTYHFPNAMAAKICCNIIVLKWCVYWWTALICILYFTVMCNVMAHCNGTVIWTVMCTERSGLGLGFVDHTEPWICSINLQVCGVWPMIND